jgi:hypothetical protein
MKDNDQSRNLRALVDAGVSSFKIEGRLKDLAYVKNITAHYRQLLDEIIAERPGHRRSSSGESSFLFVPQPEKTFNRGATDYFVRGRKADIGAFATPKFVGDEIGTVTRVGSDHFDLDCQRWCTTVTGSPGSTPPASCTACRSTVSKSRTTAAADCFRKRTADGLPTVLQAGTRIHRNRDQEFARCLARKSATRRIAVDLVLREDAHGLLLTISDERGVTAQATLAQQRQPARDGERARAGMRDSLGRLGGTIYSARASTSPSRATGSCRPPRSTSCVALRSPRSTRPAAPPTSGRCVAGRCAASALPRALARLPGGRQQPQRARLLRPPRRRGHRSQPTNAARKGEVSLMITKHCLRYSFNLCPKQVKGWPTV